LLSLGISFAIDSGVWSPSVWSETSGVARASFPDTVREMTSYERGAPFEVEAGLLGRFRGAFPKRVQLVSCSPALLMAGWLLFTWEKDESFLYRMALAVFAGFVFQGMLFICLAVASVTAAHWLGTSPPDGEDFSLREPQVLGALLLVVGLWAYDGYRDRARERQLVDCLEQRAMLTRIRAERGAEDMGDGSIDLRPGGMGYAVESCRAQASVEDASAYDE
jgi:hypothetical protein